MGRKRAVRLITNPLRPSRNPEDRLMSERYGFRWVDWPFGGSGSCGGREMVGARSVSRINHRLGGVVK
eukprot:2279715-Prymnesium_polylepis.1